MPLDADPTDTRIQRRIAELGHHAASRRWPLGGWTLAREWPSHVPRPPFADAIEQLGEPGAPDHAGVRDDVFEAPPRDTQTYWLSTTAVVPDALAGRRVTVAFETQAECMVYVDGAPWQGLDENRSRVVLAARGEAGRAYRLDVMLFSARDRRPKALSAAWVLVDDAVEAYRLDLRAALGVARTRPDGDLTAARLRQALVASVQAIDFHSAYGTVDVRHAHRTLRDALDALRATTPPTDADVYLVGNSHIDVAWLWTLPETRAKMGRTTATALRYMDELPAYRFAQSQPQLYEWLRQDFPDLFARVQQRVAEGRWEIVGATWVEPDCNLTGGEALVRQILHGQRFWQEHFGRTSSVMWLPDTFGYAWALPQILRKSGIDTFVTQKLTWNATNRFPHSHFDWEGVDGTRIRCTFPQIYVARVDPETIDAFARRVPDRETIPALLYLYGYGDGGGGPVRDDIRMGERLAAVPGFPRCHAASAREALDRIRNEAEAVAARTGRTVPVWRGELYLETHRGTLTTHARVKRANRQCEQRLREAEVWASVARARTGAAYPTAALDAAWKHVLLNQFHDILPGTSIEPVYADAHARYAEALATAEAVTAGALASLFAPPAAGSPTAFTVTNSLGWTVTDWVEADLPAGAFYLRDAAGAVVPHQLTAGGRLGFEATVPALGAAVFTVHDGAAPGSLPILAASSDQMETGRFRLRFGADGTLASLWDHALAREWLAGPAAAFQTFDDRPNMYEAWDLDPWYADQPLDLFAFQGAEVVEAGPVRAVVRQTYATPAGSVVEHDVTVYRTLPRVDFEARVDWRERRVLLKVAFPVAVHSAHAAFEIPFGAIERPTHRNTTWEQARFEVAGHRWADLSEAGGGVSVLNDATYGHDVEGHTIRLSLLRNPVYPDPRMPWEEFGLPGREAEVRHTDTGAHAFRYALLPHPGDWRQGTVAQAAVFNQPLRLTVGVPAADLRGAVAGDGVAVEVLKAAEDGDGLVLRVYEAHGGRGRATVRLPFAVTTAEPVDLMERPTDADGPVAVQGGALTFEVRPYEIRTFRLHAE